MFTGKAQCAVCHTPTRGLGRRHAQRADVATGRARPHEPDAALRCMLRHLARPLLETAARISAVDAPASTIVPRAIGHNPSKTIAALGERIAERIVAEGR